MKINNDAPFGTWLKLRRKELDLTQEELADRLGCSPWTITKIEAGERRPSRQMAELLCKELHVPEPEQAGLIALARSGKTSNTANDNPEMTDHAEAAHLAALPTAHLPLPTSHCPPGNIGIYSPLTPIIGRKSELAAITESLTQRETRLLTLLGPPGIGKTRLAIEAACALVSSFPGGVYFVPLATVSEPDAVSAAVAQALRLGEREAHLPTAILNSQFAIRNTPALLILDNFEQVVDAAPFVIELLRTCPHLHALVTSREALRVRGEKQFHLEPLELPDLSHLPSIDQLASYSAVELFVQRAGSARGDFALQEGNAHDVAAICSRLDGLPLAIELVAAHIQLLPPWALLARLGNSLTLLEGGPRDMPPRHRTLRAAISWSYDLLSEEEQALFARLALFAGGADLAAIEAIASIREFSILNSESEANQETIQDSRLRIQDSLPLLESLLNKSLIHRQFKTRDPSLEPRYSMLQTVREYGLEKLRQSKDYLEIMGDFAHYYARLLDDAEPHLTGTDTKEWLDRLERDYDNIRIALGWLIEQKDPLALKMCSPLWQLWEVRGYLNEGGHWMEKALDSVEAVDTPERARVLHVCSGLSIRQGNFEAARNFSLKSLAICERLGDRKGIGSAKQVLGIVEEAHANYTQAEAYYNESIRLFRELGHKANLSRTLNSLGVLERMRQNYERAVALFEESLQLQRELGSKRSIALTLANLGAVAVARKEWEKAQELFTASLELRREIGHKVGVGDCLIGLAFVSIAGGDLRKAVRLFAAGDHIYEGLDYRMEPSDFPQYEYYLDQARKGLSEEEFASAWDEGRAMELEEAAAYAVVPSYQPPAISFWSQT